MRKLFKVLGLGFLLFLIILCAFLRLRYGGGEYYPSVATEPLLPRDSLELFFEFDEPLGNIAVSTDNRVFFTVHPESRPANNKVLEIVNGVAVPFPNQSFQSTHFETVLGLFIDTKHQLWTIDHGNHGSGNVRILAFDLETKETIYDHTFDSEIAPLGSFFNDLQVDIENGFVYIADFNFFGRNPALVVHDLNSGKSRRLLESHSSVFPQDWIIRSPVKEMTFVGGLVALKPGIDGIVLDHKNEYVYWGAMAHDRLYKIPTSVINDFNAPHSEIEDAIITVGKKPMSDGLSIDTLGNIYITDVENQGLAIMTPEGELSTLIRDDRVTWADGCSFGGDGYLYFTDSELPNQMLKTKSAMLESAPYGIFRFKPTHSGIPGR